MRFEFLETIFCLNFFYKANVLILNILILFYNLCMFMNRKNKL